MRDCQRLWIPVVLVLASGWPPPGRADVPVTQTFSDGSDDDQDDMCFWVPTEPATS